MEDIRRIEFLHACDALVHCGVPDTPAPSEVGRADGDYIDSDADEVFEAGDVVPRRSSRVAEQKRLTQQRKARDEEARHRAEQKAAKAAAAARRKAAKIAKQKAANVAKHEAAKFVKSKVVKRAARASPAKKGG